MNKLNIKATDLDLVPGLYAMQKHFIEHSKFFETLFGKRERESRAVDRQVEFFQDVSQSSDVVLVAVGEYDRGKVVSIFLEKIEIGYRDIDTVRCFFGKAHAG